MLLAQRQSSDPMASLRHTSSNQLSLPIAYPIPAQRTYGRDGSQRSEGLSFAEHELLRSRKTPYGRIDEQYEATVVDKNIYMPASKHVLLSASPQASGAYKDYFPGPHGQNIQNQEAAMNTNRYGHDIGSDRHPIPMPLDASRPMWELPGGVDSALHQTMNVPDQRYFYHPESQIPTVLPASYNAHIGPTASAGQQHYGPYWPDGTFNPYRPAPVRDNRFFGRGPEFEVFRPLPHSDHRTLRRSGRLLSIRDPTVALSNYRASPQTASQNFLPFADRVLNAKLSRNEPYRHQGVEEIPADFTPELCSRDVQTIKAIGTDRRREVLYSNEASERIAFRDRTFTWAHQIYVELLTKIQREHKLGRPPTGSTGQPKSSTKPVIFPKPPQRTGSYFKQSIDSSQRKPSSFVDSRTFTWVGPNGSHVGRSLTDSDAPPRRASDHGELHEIVNPQPFTQIPQRLQQTGSSNLTFRRISDPNVQQLQSHRHPLSSPITALSALNTMEALCNEAGTPWTDGMLLAGCLAYGLGDYPRALVWYRKIIAQDPKHVEAISNMAATLLALGKREDALQSWSAAVKLRPSYFEAVEHLIGLLCSAHRARDAVEMIEYVERQLKLATPVNGQYNDTVSDGESDEQSRSSSTTTAASTEHGVFEYDIERRVSTCSSSSDQQALGFGSSGYAISGADNGRLLALIHAKGNMLYGLGDNAGAAASFEDAILIATGHSNGGIHDLIERILHSCISNVDHHPSATTHHQSKEPILLSPEMAQHTAQRMFPPGGELPGLEHVFKGLASKAAISTTSNSLLSLAKIYQDGLNNTNPKLGRRKNGTREILALYYLSLSLQRSPSTANNVGILLAGVQQTSTNSRVSHQPPSNSVINYTGIAPGSGIALALQYYNYGLNIDPKHAHLYTNLGSLLKDLGQLPSAIKMYEIAVQCDGNFDIALANLANAVKDQGRITDAITYYRRAVQANPDFAEAVCGLATALNSVCNWYGRGGVYADNGLRDRVHVDEHGMMQEARKGSGWMNRVVEIVDKQLRDGEFWGSGILTSNTIERLCQQLVISRSHLSKEKQQRFYRHLHTVLQDWSGQRWEGTRVVRLIERAIRQIGWQWYQDRYRFGKEYPERKYARPLLPGTLSSPTAPTVLPFHTFTTPLSAKQVRQISQRNALRISVSALRSSWLPPTVYPPPKPPSSYLNVGYVSSDFNNHPLAHLMQSIFGLHDTSRVRAFCYATTASDGSIHRQQIEREAPVFYDASAWSVENLVNCIVRDNIHILVNLNGYTRGARNEVFAARPAPIHMSFMGYAGTLGAEWCDYVYADSISILPGTLAPWRRSIDVEDSLQPEALAEDREDWMYAENIIFAKSTFFCVDHKQSAPDSNSRPPPSNDQGARDTAWRAEQDRRWRLRKEIFPTLSDDFVILGNFNQLYKIDPSTFRMYLRILARVRNAILWLLRFPDVGEQHLKRFAREWAGEEVASRVVFTDVAPKGAHITRASVVDLFLDTPECNAHTTAADVVWSGTPIVTWARWDYKMCSRMASSIVTSALPEGPSGDRARSDLLVDSDEQYERQSISLALDLDYSSSHGVAGRGSGRLMELRRILWEGRWTSRLFDTKRWVRDLERAYWEAWRRWEKGEEGDIWL